MTSCVAIAPIGLIDMFNSGGALLSFTLEEKDGIIAALFSVKGCGRFGIYCSVRPSTCDIDGNVIEIEYNEEDGMALMNLENESSHIKLIRVVFGINSIS